MKTAGASSATSRGMLQTALAQVSACPCGAAPATISADAAVARLALIDGARQASRAARPTGHYRCRKNQAGGARGSSWPALPHLDRRDAAELENAQRDFQQPAQTVRMGSTLPGSARNTQRVASGALAPSVVAGVWEAAAPDSLRKSERPPLQGRRPFVIQF